MKTLRNSLAVAFLLIACIVGLQVSFLLAQADGALQRLELSLGGLLSTAGQTLALARSSLAAQQGYYRDSASHVKALTKAAAIDAIHFGRLIEASQRTMENTDTRIERITAAAESSLDAARAAAATVADQTQSVGNESQTLLKAATETTNSIGNLASDTDLKQSLTNLEASTENLQKTTAAAAEATGYIRDMLSPTKKSFWRRLLELMIPRPTVNFP
jgi:hypothetical protein